MREPDINLMVTNAKELGGKWQIAPSLIPKGVTVLLPMGLEGISKPACYASAAFEYLYPNWSYEVMLMVGGGWDLIVLEYRP